MRPSYLVLRNQVYHLRIRVPTTLTAVLGCSEVRLSLGDTRKRQAELKAGYLGYQARQFFSYLRCAMKSLSNAQIEQLVARWRASMATRDADVRRLYETGLGSTTLDSWANSLDATGETFASLANGLLPPSVIAPDRTAFSGARQAAAWLEAESLAGAAADPSDPEADWVPLLARPELSQLDEASRRKLLLEWLPAAARMYFEKSAACAEVGGEVLAPPTSRPLVEAHQEAILPVPQALQAADKATTPALSLAGAWERYTTYQSQREAAWREVVPDSARQAAADLLGLLGPATDIRQVDRGAMRRFEEFMNRRPRRNVRTYRGKTQLELAAMDIPLSDRLSPTSAGEHLDRIGAFFRWCENEHLIDRNPAASLSATLPPDGASRPRREAWTLQEIQTLLDPAKLREFVESRANAQRRSNAQRLTYFPWLLVLAAYTGARLEELGGLEVDDLVYQHQASQGRTPVMLIRENELRGLKTSQAARAVPIHPDLEAMGIWDLQGHRRDHIGANQLLWVPPRGDRVAGKVTDDFAAYTRSLGLYKKDVKVFHSFRHTFKTACRGLDMDDGALNSIIGHAATDSTRGTYEHGLEVPRHIHLEKMSRLTFNLDVGGLARLLAECRSTSDSGRSYAIRRPSAVRT